MKTLTLPKGSPDPLPELAAFLEPFAPLFSASHQSSLGELAAPASSAAFPPARQMSLPAWHRKVLVLLFQDLVLWLIETEQVIRRKQNAPLAIDTARLRRYTVGG